MLGILSELPDEKPLTAAKQTSKINRISLMKAFTDKVVLFTGGTSGIERATTLAFAQEEAALSLLNGGKVKVQNPSRSLSKRVAKGFSSKLMYRSKMMLPLWWQKP